MPLTPESVARTFSIISCELARELSLIGRELHRVGSNKLFRIWNTQPRDLPRDPLTSALKAASVVYEGMLRADQAHALANRTKLPAFVISVGNISCGGTGKTPLALWICEYLAQSGRRAAILSRGYGRSGKGAVRVGAGEERGFREKPLEAAEIVKTSEIYGDEPVLMASRLPSTPVWVGRKRSESGKAALAENPRPEFLVLDDGFQHLALDRDLDIALIDSRNPFGNGCTLPLGPLREPVSHLERADAFVLTHADAGLRFEITKSTVERLFPGKPLFSCIHRITGFRAAPVQHAEFGKKPAVFAPGQAGYISPEAVAGRKAAAFAGIAGPEGFFDALARLGIDLVAGLSFPDHHRYTISDVLHIIGETSRTGAEFILTTAKDAVRLPTAITPAVLTAELKLDFGPDDQKFRDFLQKSLAAGVTRP